MSSGNGRVGRGLAGLAGLTLLVVGIPVGLTAAGEGPAIHLGQIGGSGNGLLQPVSDSTLVRLAVLACWVVWLLFVVAVAIEVLAALRAGAGRARARIRIPAFQGGANALVLSALLLLPQRGLTAGAVTRSPLNHAMASAVVPTAPALIVSSHPERTGPVSRDVVTRPAASAKVARYVVRRYDSPWGIAERHLGDGTRWRELRDERGKTLSIEAGDAIQPPGGQRRQARIIRPGEVLYLPEGAQPVDVRPEVLREATGTRSEARPSPTVRSASSAPPSAPLGPTAEAPAVTAVAPPSAPQDWSPVAETEKSTTGVPAPNSPLSVSSPALPSSGRGRSLDDSSAPSIKAESPTVAAGATHVEDQPPTIMEVTADRHTRSTLSTTLVEAGLLSAGVLGTLLALRRRQAQHRPAGRRLRLPGRALAATESAVRLGARPEQVDQIDRAMHRLVADLQRTQMAVPSVLAVVAGQSGLEVLLGDPLAPPAPWTPSAEGFRWRLATAELAPTPPAGSAPLPALVPVGKAGEDGSEVLLNLEAAGLLCVIGEADKADSVIRALATSLSGLGWAQAVNLILVGFGSELDSVAHVRTVASVTSVLSELRSTAQLLGEAIGNLDPFAARVSQPGSDGWAPTIVCCAGALDPAERAELVRLAKPGTGVVAVISGDSEPSGWTIDVDSRPMAVQPLRLAVDPTLLPAEDLKQIGELYTVAMDDSGVTGGTPPYRDLDISADRPPISLAERLQRVEPVLPSIEAARPGGPILALNGHGNGTRPAAPSAQPINVSVLGTVEIDGALVFKRAKSKELAVYLALHPNGVGEAELDEALWPSGNGRLVAPSTRDSTVSVARSALGGPTRLLPAQGHGREKRYQVSDDVGTDWSRFCQLHRDGRAGEDPGLLGQALELVRGRPFEGVIAGRTYGWVHTEGHARHIEAEVADAADLAAELLLAKGQAIDARWAARRGLMADPYVERLWVRLMEGADQLGDGQDIERIMDEMDVVLDLQGDFSGLHPHTLAAYDRLSRRRRLPR